MITSRLCPFIVLVCYIFLPVYLWSSVEWSLILRPAPFLPTGATGPQWRLLPRSLSRSQSWCLRRRFLPCSCIRVSRCVHRFRLSFLLFPRQPPVDPGLFPPSLGDPCTPPPPVPSQSPIIGRVAMNCATVFCLRRTDVRARTIPASLVAPARGRYIHCPSLPRRGMRPISRRATLPWKASRAASILLVRTQVSAPKRRTCCVTAI